MGRIAIENITANMTDEDEDKFNQLWKLILESAKHQAQWEREVPVKWLALEREIMRARGDGSNYLTFKDVVAMNQTCEEPLPKDAELKLFLK